MAGNFEVIRVASVSYLLSEKLVGGLAADFRTS
jgi:hypothetical protein